MGWQLFIFIFCRCGSRYNQFTSIVFHINTSCIMFGYLESCFCIRFFWVRSQFVLSFFSPRSLHHTPICVRQQLEFIRIATITWRDNVRLRSVAFAHRTHREHMSNHFQFIAFFYPLLTFHNEAHILRARSPPRVCVPAHSGNFQMSWHVSQRAIHIKLWWINKSRPHR